MPRETTHIDVSGDDKWLGAAGYLAVLAYPDDWDKRTRFIDAVKAMMIKYMTGGRLPKKHVKNSDVLQFAKERELDTALRQVGRIIQTKRLPAWEIALPYMMSHAINVTLADGSKFSLDRALEQKFPSPDVEFGADPYNKNNAYKRVWIPSKPVLHLMFGLHNALADYNHKPDTEDLICNPDWLPFAAENAESIRKTLCALDKININDEDTIQLLPKNNISVRDLTRSRS